MKVNITRDILGNVMASIGSRSSLISISGKKIGGSHFQTLPPLGLIFALTASSFPVTCLIPSFGVRPPRTLPSIPSLPSLARSIFIVNVLLRSSQLLLIHIPIERYGWQASLRRSVVYRASIRTRRSLLVSIGRYCVTRERRSSCHPHYVRPHDQEG